MSVSAYIPDIPYFTGVRQSEIDYIARTSLLYAYDSGESIFIEGGTSQGLWIVESGHVKVFKLNTEGTEHILHLRGKGKTFNDISALDGGYNPANASALSPDVRVWLIPCEAIAYVLQHNSTVAMNVIQLLTRRVRSLVSQIEDLALYSVTARLARFLLRQANDSSLRGQGITRTAIASHLNTTPQTISVVLREIERAGAIEFNRHQIFIIREDILKTIALL